MRAPTKVLTCFLRVSERPALGLLCQNWQLTSHVLVSGHQPYLTEL
jgi:hypothetical protein